MAADTIRSFLETGTIKNSVNFPSAKLKARNNDHVRISVVSKNDIGVSGAVMSLLGDAEISVAQNLNVSKGNVAYVLRVHNIFPLGKRQHPLLL